MSVLYTVEINENNSITVSKPSSTTLCYRVNYSELKSGKHGLEIKNPFIVYILHGKNYEGKDYLYIGKSKNGILNRPQSHENMNIKWDMCYVLTQFVERTMLNDGTLQYIEDIITEKAKETKCFEVKTKQTTKGAANKSDKYMCKLFLEDALDMLNILGLDLKTIRVENTILDNIIDSNKRYWVYAAGEQSIHWDDFYNQGIMALGWNEVGDLSKYNSKEEIKNALINNRNSNNSYSQAVSMLWQFANEMKPGDIIFVKRGVQEIVGKGEVVSNYYYDKNNIDGYTHIRKVNWTDKGKCSIKNRLAMKTLTDITPYKEYIAEFNNLNFSNNIIETIDTKKEILINQLFTGKYNNIGDNIGHEIINIFKDDSDTYNLFITPGGKVENHNIDTILFVKNEDKPYVVEVVGMATNLQIFNADKDPLITYNGKTEKKIFYGNQYNGTLETNDESPVMYRTNDIKMPVNRLYLGVKDLVNDDNIILIDNNGKRLTNTSMRSYHKEGSDIYKQLEEIINSIDWKPLDTEEIYKRCSDNKIFEQQYTRFLNKINK